MDGVERGLRGRVRLQADGLGYWILVTGWSQQASLIVILSSQPQDATMSR